MSAWSVVVVCRLAMSCDSEVLGRTTPGIVHLDAVDLDFVSIWRVGPELVFRITWSGPYTANKSVEP